MEKEKRGGWHVVCTVLAVLAALGLGVLLLYRTERRVRRLFWMMEQRLNPTRGQMELDI
ncbi:MAG: hypothetical protein II363_00090 [Clostridia bacterium]|nr:hypothetical protein [Clostridia bacterium]